MGVVALRPYDVLKFVFGEQKDFAKGLGPNVAIAHLGNEQALLGKSIKGLQLALDDGLATIHTANRPQYLHFATSNENAALDALPGLEDVVVWRIDVEIVFSALGQGI